MARGKAGLAREMLSPTPEDGPIAAADALPPKLLGVRRMLESDASAASARIQHGVQSPHSSDFGSSTLGSSNLGDQSHRAVSLDETQGKDRRTSVALSLPDRSMLSAGSSQQAGEHADSGDLDSPTAQKPAAASEAPRERRKPTTKLQAVPVSAAAVWDSTASPHSRLRPASPASYSSDPSGLDRGGSRHASSLASAASLQAALSTQQSSDSLDRTGSLAGSLADRLSPSWQHNKGFDASAGRLARDSSPAAGQVCNVLKMDCAHACCQCSASLRMPLGL